MDYLCKAKKIFAGTKYKATGDDIKRLADNMALLDKRGLGKLNERLEKANTVATIFATIAEHNFAVILASRHDLSVPISYEPDMNGRPVDFKVEIGDVTYWIQMKDLAKLARENRQDKIIQKIKGAAREVKIGKFFSCKLSDGFEKNSVSKLIEFIKNKAATATEEESFLFTGENDQKAKIEFWSANNIQLSGLTLGSGGDIKMVDITGENKNQIKRSFCNAAGAFCREVDDRTINLIAMEADNKEDIDLCDALFGTEYEIVGKDSHSWSRKDDGLFRNKFSKKVAGIIAIKRKRERFKESEISQLPHDAAGYADYLKKECGWTDEKIREALKEGKDPRPIADYHLLLYMNDEFKYLLENIERLLSFDKVIYCNMRPPMGKGNFELS